MVKAGRMLSGKRAIVAVSPGDPGGVGPELVMRVAAEHAASSSDSPAIVLFGDGAALMEWALRLGCGPKAALYPDAERASRAAREPTGPALACVDLGVRWDQSAHAATADNGLAQLQGLHAAAEACRHGLAEALLTGPISKEAVSRSGTPFRGHTEYLAQACGLQPDAVTMLFLGPRARVALVTTHLPLRQVADAVTATRVARSCLHLSEALLSRRPDRAGPLRVAITGLNPHAGEGGILGDEEIQAIEPGLAMARSQAGARVEWLGPLGAETALRWQSEGRVDGVVCMTHDQATIASKLLDWQQAANVTWGLPFVRTSVDHGVAYDAARARTADPTAMKAAFSTLLEFLVKARPSAGGDGVIHPRPQQAQREGRDQNAG